MAINLLNAQRLGLNGANLSLNPNAPALNKLGINTNAAPAPMGQKAVSPSGNVPKVATTLPKAQQAPLAIAPVPSAPVPPTVPESVPSPTGTIGTQHPGDAGFNPVLPVNPANQNHNTPSYNPPAPQPAPTPTTFPGLLGAAVNQQNSPFNQSARASIAGTQGAAQSTYGQGYGNAAQYGEQANTAVKQLQNIQTGVATGIGNINQEAIPLQFQQGRGQALQTMYGGQEQALASEIQGLGSLYGTAAGQQSTGISGLNASGQTALTGQGQTYGALQSAAGLAKPEVVGQGQAVFDPLTAQTSGGSYDPQVQAHSFAQSVMDGTMTYDQAVQSMGYSPVGKTALDQAITAQGGQPLALQAQGSSQQGIIGSQQQQVAGYQSALQQGQNLQSQLSDLITHFGLNPADLNAANVGLQKIAQNVSSPQYKILANYINDIANTYAQVLTPPGGSATDTTRGIATSMLDATAKGTSIMATMQSLDQAARAKIAGVSTTGAQNHAAPSSGGTTVQTKAGPVNTNW